MEEELRESLLTVGGGVVWESGGSVGRPLEDDIYARNEEVTNTETL